MRTFIRSAPFLFIAAATASLPAGCGSTSSSTPGTGWMSAGSTAGTGGSTGNGTGGSTGAGTGGGGTTGQAGTGGSAAGTGGANARGGTTGSAGAIAGTTGSGGTGTSNADAGAACTIGAFPAADPSMPGPFATMTENNVGPAAGVGADGGAAPMFTMFRPKDLAQGGLCHPVITWGNGTGSTPSLYKVLLNHLASHGFVVIASNSPQVSMGDPPPMLAGVTWVLEQNADPSSALYQRIDTTHIGTTGHSQGGFAATSAGSDARITTIAPCNGATSQRNLHGPAFLFCGGMDTTVPCSTIMSAYNGISNQPVMLADYLAADHANWISFSGNTVKPVEATVTAWMRVHLMGDTALRGRFYGASCTLCQDSAWMVMRKMMDQ
jgi:hypothetical protein